MATGNKSHCVVRSDSLDLVERHLLVLLFELIPTFPTDVVSPSTPSFVQDLVVLTNAPTRNSPQGRVNRVSANFTQFLIGRRPVLTKKVGIQFPKFFETPSTSKSF